MKELILLSLPLATLAQNCGYAPLCGTEVSEFDWDDAEVGSISGEQLLGAELSFDSCCALGDTEPTQDCEIVNPSGEHERWVESSDPICGDGGEDCRDLSCDNYFLVIKPYFERPTQDTECCNSCTCYGDPQCVSFDGTYKIWMLCDGRDVPHEDSIYDYCRITEEVCEDQRDHAGNQCMYLADDPRGRGWTVGKLGSPCVPNPASPPSTILMYSAPSAGFSLSIEQGERGIILAAMLTLESGQYTLSAESCLDDPSNPWEFEEDELPGFFYHADVVEGRDQLWTIVDPESGIAVTIRCHGNFYEDDDAYYVARLNIDDLSEPQTGRPNVDGFCATNDIDYGESTWERTEEIEEGGLCSDGLQGATEREVYRAICRNPGLPGSAIQSCVYHFCSEFFAPLYDNVAECQAALNVDLAEGWCRGVVYDEDDVDTCVRTWNNLGAVETIEQYYDDREGCHGEVQTELEKCQSGLMIQYYRNDQWNDAVAVPSDYCGGEEIRIPYCEDVNDPDGGTNKYLFNRNIRIIQKAANSACSPVNQCATVDGVRVDIALVTETPQPTEFPTPFPTPEPTEFPSPFPTAFPTPFPGDPPTASPLSEENPDCVQDWLCETPPGTVDFEDDDDTWSYGFPSCCPDTECYVDPDANRTVESNRQYCGGDVVEDSYTGERCQDQFELEIKVSFTREESCCEECTCFGDPRCYSFSGKFAEFILCDGRSPVENPDERCYIRRESCEEQLDHEGNECMWGIPDQPGLVPDLSDPTAQFQAENDFSVARYGSPCRYNPDESSMPIVDLYTVPEAGYSLTTEIGERGYIQTVFLEMDSGRYELHADSCADGEGWVVRSGSVDANQFQRHRYGREYVWDVNDRSGTGIQMKFRCTGNLVGGSYANTFINVEQIAEPNINRIGWNDNTGYCALDQMVEKRLASTDHTAQIRNDGVCDFWNEDLDDILRREIARSITGNPAVVLTGVNNAFTEFCQLFFSPGYSSVSNCVNAFMNNANSVSDFIRYFCRATTLERAACEENLEVQAEVGGYKIAFNNAYEQYVKNFESDCVVTPNDLPAELDFSDGTCATGVELQFWNPRKDEWITYTAFPSYSAPCASYTVKYTFDDHPKLFKNPLRLVQRYNFEACSTCTSAEEVEAFFTFSTNQD